MDYEKKYKEALETARKINSGEGVAAPPDWTICEVIFPELAESEDERIRKVLIDYFKSYREVGTCGAETFNGIPTDNILTWLEKQCSQNNTEDEDILHRFCFYSYKDESNILYLSGLYVNGECRNKGIGTKILEVADEVAKSLNCNAIRLKTEIGSNAERLYRRNGYNTFKREGNNVWLEKQCEKKPTDDFKAEDWYVSKVDGKIHNMTHSPNNKDEKSKWTDEDDNMLDKIVNSLIDSKYVDSVNYNIMYDWLNSIKQRMEE